MERIFHHYSLWEDYLSGMYNPPSKVSISDGVTSEERIEKAVELLSNETLCLQYMRKVVSEWKVGTEQVLTNKNQNRKAWLGWCACFMYGGCHDEETRFAWGLLDNETRAMANKSADTVIKEWVGEREQQESPQYTMFDDWGNMF